MQALAKLYIGFPENEIVSLVDEIVDFHCQHLDPNEVTVSIAFIQLLESEEALKKRPCFRASVLQTQYTNEKVRGSAGAPGVSQFIEPSSVIGLCRKPDLLLAVETEIREIRAKYLPLLEKQCPSARQGWSCRGATTWSSGASSAKPGPPL